MDCKLDQTHRWRNFLELFLGWWGVRGGSNPQPLFVELKIVLSLL